MFLSKTDQREREQRAPIKQPSDADLFHGESSWGDTFTAGLGVVIDEELSISSLLNNEGYAQRDEEVKLMAEEGFDLKPYTARDGMIDYDQLAHDTDGRIQTNLEVFQARNAELERRRNYSEDVVSRGNGAAQFLGAMNGYMLDPINVATLPLGASASALRGASTLARVAHVAKVEAGIALAAEVPIQFLVTEHKNQIGSPYEIEDAIAAIGTAALGAAAIGGTSAGIAGYFRSLSKATEGIDTLEARGAREIVEKQAAMLEANPERMAGVERAKAEMISATSFEPMPVARKGIEAWHGTPHKVDKFSSEKIGTGEGAQAYGHGLYFAEAKATAESYKDALKRVTIDGQAFDGGRVDGLGDLAASALRSRNSDVDTAIEYLLGKADRADGEAKRLLDEAVGELRAFDRSRIVDDGGNLYRVYLDVDEDKLLDWDRSFDKQPQGVKDAVHDAMRELPEWEEFVESLPPELRAAADEMLTSPHGWLFSDEAEKYWARFDVDGPDPNIIHDLRQRWKLDENPMGADIYGDIIRDGMPPETASRWMDEWGIQGIRYADGMSRYSDGGTSNFVVFDDSRIRMEHELENTLLVDADSAYMRKMEEARLQHNQPKIKAPEDQPEVKVDVDQDVDRLLAIETDDPTLKAFVEQQKLAAAEQEEAIAGLNAILECNIA